MALLVWIIPAPWLIAELQVDFWRRWPLRGKNSEAIFRIDLAAKLVSYGSPERRHSAGAFKCFHVGTSSFRNCGW